MSDKKICKVCSYNEATTTVEVYDDHYGYRQTACCGQCKEWQENLAFDDEQLDKMVEWREAYWDDYFNPNNYSHHY